MCLQFHLIIANLNSFTPAPYPSLGLMITQQLFGVYKLVDFCGSNRGGISIKANPLYMKNDHAFKFFKNGRVFIFVNKLKKVLDFQKMFVFLKVCSEWFCYDFSQLLKHVQNFRKCSCFQKLFTN